MASKQSSEEAAVREEVQIWLKESWDQDRPLGEWREILVDSGWACPTWPKEWYGKGLSQDLANVVAEEFSSAGAVGGATGVGMSLAGPTLLEHGSDELKRRLLRGIITGQDKWCQLFSEPGNGSDLAGVTTRSDRDGDEWVVNGQKVWTTGAQHAAFGLLLARTDWDAPKHRGITYFAFPMTQPGVEVRPLSQMNGHASFNEVFITDARVPDANVVGDVGGGWAVALATLAHERGLAAGRMFGMPSGGQGRTGQEAFTEMIEYAKTYMWYPQRAGRSDLVQSQAQAMGVNTVPSVRQQVARIHTLDKVARWNVDRARAARRQGRPPGPEGSLSKLLGSEIGRQSAKAHAQIAGAHGMLTGPDSLLNGIVAEVIVSVPAGSIAGGADEIQHNIIGERVLGLPKEPEVDADVPFREVRTNKPRS